MKQIVRMLLLILCGAIVGVNIYLINARNLIGNQLPMPFGYGAAVVLSGSMEPELSIDDLIIVKKAKQLQLQDVVVFQDDTSLIVHRIIEKDGDHLVTKGDANNVADEPISETAVKGVVIGAIPGIGRIVNFLKTPTGILCTILLALALLEIPYRNEKKQDEEERQKIIDEIRRLKDE